MQISRFAVSLGLSLLPLGLLAQSKPDVSYMADTAGPQHSFALVVQSSAVTMSGGWHPIAQLARYAQHHPGTYIVFTQGGELRRLDTPERIAEAQHIYAPMQELSAEQQGLAAEQKPFAAQQRVLAAQQRAATDPHAMTRIGAEQAELGEQQGDIGRLQGALGRKQGEIGRALYNRVQAMLDACVADHTCPLVTDETAHR